MRKKQWSRNPQSRGTVGLDIQMQDSSGDVDTKEEPMSYATGGLADDTVVETNEDPTSNDTNEEPAR